MTNNHLLLYRLAELMLEKQQHILALDDLFEDEQIGAFVRSIQIDSPYQQLIFEEVLTETIKEERVMVTFTVEGYFHYVLGEVIEQQTLDKGAEALKQLLENNKLIGITEGVEQCLVRDVEKNDLSRLMWLIDEGGKALDASAYPLAQAFLIHPIERVMDELLADPTDNDIEILEKTINKLESSQKSGHLNSVLKQINLKLNPLKNTEILLFIKSIKTQSIEIKAKQLRRIAQKKQNIEKDNLQEFYFLMGNEYLKAEKFIDAQNYFLEALKISNSKFEKIKTLRMLSSLSLSLNKIEKSLSFLNKAIKLSSKKEEFNSDLGRIYDVKRDLKKSIKYHQKSLTNSIKEYGRFHPQTAVDYTNLLSVYNNLGDYSKVSFYAKKSLEISLKTSGEFSLKTATAYNNYGLSFLYNKKFEKALEFFHKAKKIQLSKNKNLEMADVHNNISLCYKNLSKIDEAIYHQKKSIKLTRHYKKGISQDYLTSMNNLAILYGRKKDFDSEYKTYKKVIGFSKKIYGKSDNITANSYYNLGFSYFENNNKIKGAFYFKKALKSYGEIDSLNNDKINYILWRLGDYYEVQEKYNTAIKYYENLLKNEIKNLDEHHLELNDLVITIANCYYYSDNLKKAILFFEKSLKINKMNNNKEEYDKIYELVCILKKEITSDQ